MKVLLLDHEDSFVYNLYQALQALGADVRCARYTEPLSELVAWDPDTVVLSPGPGHPGDVRLTGRALQLLERWHAERPFLGVCLGHQILGEFYGGSVGPASAPVHGETVEIRHHESPMFAGIPHRFRGARYHSLIVRRTGLPRDLVVTAESSGKTIMAMAHRGDPTYGVQFHPESYLTPYGPKVLRNFLGVVRR